MVRDRDETETFDFQSETRSRPRPSDVSTRPRRGRDVWKLRLETVSRPRRRDRDYIPAYYIFSLSQLTTLSLAFSDVDNEVILEEEDMLGRVTVIFQLLESESLTPQIC